MADTDIHIFSVKEITQYIKKTLTSDPNLQDIYIQGEISNFVHHSSGHYYFTLKDENSQLPAAMFRWANEKLKFKIKDGMKVLVFGNVDVYEPQGKYNFIVHEVHPKGTGELYLKFIQLKEKLSEEGLFDIEHKKPLPKYPHRIGIITSSTGAAIRDILNITHRRAPQTDIVVVPCLVQGAEAAQDIVRSISLLNQYSQVDVAIVGRGGGSLEDLWPFNEEIVARAIFSSKIPIISAVGHETDFSISDFVADLRAPTPSAAAELAVTDKNEVIRDINKKVESMIFTMQSMIQLDHKHLVGISSALKPRMLLDRIVQYQQHSDDITSKVIMQINHILALGQQRFEKRVAKLDAVSPLSTLKRGYSITRKLPQDIVVDTVSNITIGDDIKVVLYDGELKCNVNEIDERRIVSKNPPKEV